MYGNIEVHSVSGFIGQGLGRKIRKVTVCRADIPDCPADRRSVVSGSDGVAVAEIDLHLPGSPLMMGGLGCDAHFLQGEADIAAQVFSAVQRFNIHVSRPVDGGRSRLSLFVPAENIKFHLGTKLDFYSAFCRRPHSLAQDVPGIPFKRSPVGPGHITEDPAHTAH